ncbi:M20 family metallopeptidase [Streptomyces sp. NPDC058304]|uniref:M20 metallopeptidase family protein n=1 Tax=Streptomyces sp. NPDC058304 TaxID=3346437 RepID=UPI0036F04C74
MTAFAGPPTGLHTLLDEAHRLLPGIIDVRRTLHRAPELGLHLPLTQQTVLEALTGLPLRITAGERLSSVVATLDGAQPGRTILLRADMDALPQQEDTGLDYASQIPSAMHACGHDLHTAMLIGAARLLCARRGQIRGRVVFMFQPAEERGGGAPYMIEEGVLDTPDGSGVDAAFALHVMTRFETGTVHVRPGPMFAASDLIRITVRGRGGHASAPHLALDPVPVACEIVQALQTAVTRTVSVFDPVVVSITRIQAGTTTNIIPETAELHGTCRTLTLGSRERMRTVIERVASNVAAAHGAEADIDPAQGYPPVHNDPAFTTTVRDAATELLGTAPVQHLADPVMASEDFSYVLERVPGAMALLGARPPSIPADGAPDCHSNRVVFDENAMATGMSLHAAVALRYLAG